MWKLASKRWISQVGGVLENVMNPETVPSSSKYNNIWSVLVVHPKVRWGSGSASVLKNSERQLEEAAALVNDVPSMIVVDKVIMPLDYNTKRKTVWATGNIEKLVNRREQARATAMMVNVDVLSPIQQNELFNLFGIPIFDRYNIVLALFKAYARTEEAKLQIALAELPYIKNRVHAISSKRLCSKPEVLHIDQQYLEFDGDLDEALRKREQDLKKQLKETSRKSAEYNMKTNAAYDAVVAVVGYTNAGKTSLVKKLTGSASLKPQDRLFATLDTTRHFAKLPSGRSVIFTDTIGFLSDLPMHLISAFKATLSHVKNADVIIHMRDVSNPDWKSQEEDVISTLKSIGVNEKIMESRMITVDNKIDKEGAVVVENETDRRVRISCKNGSGLKDLINIIDKNVMLATKCKTIRLRVDVKSPIVEYLYRNGFVVVEPEVNENTLIFDVVMNELEIGRFRKQFGHLKKKE